MISSFLPPASLSFTHSLDTSDANPRALLLLLLDAKTRSYATLGRSHAARTRSAVVRAIILALFLLFVCAALCPRKPLYSCYTRRAQYPV